MSAESEADELVARVLEKEQRDIKAGVDYSEQEVRVAIRNATKQIVGIPVALGMITTSLRVIRRRLFISNVLLFLILLAVLAR